MAKAKKKAPAKPEIEYDADAAERGWEATKSLRDAIESASLPNLDLKNAARLGLSAAQIVLKPEIRRRYELLSPKLFDHAILDRIEPAAWAVWFAETRREPAEARDSTVQVDVAIIAKALDMKTRMLKVCDYVLVDPKDLAEVASIRSGQGYMDLASDLSRLATLYTKHSKVFADGGGVHYRASDLRDAKRTSAEILAELSAGETPPVQKAKADAALAFAVLQSAYDELRIWQAPLFRKDVFPTLYALRPRRSGASTKADAGTGNDTGDDSTDAET